MGEGIQRQYRDDELEYAAQNRCRCGAGLAAPIDFSDSMTIRAWVCSLVLKHGASGDGHDAFPFAFYKIREETSINNRSGMTTRPTGTVAMTVGKAICGACLHEWESEPYKACGLSHHWFSGACPNCGNDCGGNGTWSSNDKRPRIDSRYRTVVLPVNDKSATGE